MSSRLILWRVVLDRTAPPQARVVLSSDEWERAARYVRTEDAERFIHTRAALRFALGGVLGIDPGQVTFEIGPAGKPHLARRPRTPVDFSVAHTRGMALIGLSNDGPIGVDIEPLDTPPENLEPVREVLNPEEARSVQSSAGDERSIFLLQAWIAREALVKASGVGLGGMDLRAIWVSGKGEDLRQMRVPADHDHPRGWWLQFLEVGHAHIGALVTSGKRTCDGVQTWHWD